MTKLFGTNGVRGVINEDLTSKVALQVGKALAAVTPGTIAIATDARYTCEMLLSAVSSGIMAVGSNVIFLGMLPTPALQYYVKTHNVAGGVMITASHNPPEFNGIKVIASDGTEATPEQEAAIEAKYDEFIPLARWDRVGSMKTVGGYADEYVNSILSKLDVDKIKEADLTVVLDCANGASAYTSPLLLKKLGVRAITLNCNPQGEFPGHRSEPTEDNLQDLISMVKKTGAVLGMAHDGDADRCVFVDNEGNYVPGDIALAVLGKSLIKQNGGGIVVTSLAASSAIGDSISSIGGEVIRTAIGSPKVARKMMEVGSIFGGEENGGLIFADHQYCRDGAMAIGRMLECIIENGPLKNQIDALPKYHSVRLKIHCPDNFKADLISYIDKSTEGFNKDYTDGLKIITDSGWVLVRPSGTEPLFRIYAESSNKTTVEQMAKKYEEMVVTFLESM